MVQQLALKNIFQVDRTETRDVQITGVAGLGKYRTVDVYSRTWTVYSDQKWNNGDFVSIQLGRIVGKANAFKVPKIYNV